MKAGEIYEKNTVDWYVSESGYIYPLLRIFPQLGGIFYQVRWQIEKDEINQKTRGDFINRRKKGQPPALTGNQLSPKG